MDFQIVVFKLIWIDYYSHQVSHSAQTQGLAASTLEVRLYAMADAPNVYFPSFFIAARRSSFFSFVISADISIGW